MSRYLVDDFGFDSIPQNVIKNAIRRTELTESRDGVLFKMKPEDIGLLFPDPVEYDLCLHE